MVRVSNKHHAGGDQYLIYDMPVVLKHSLAPYPCRRVDTKEHYVLLAKLKSWSLENIVLHAPYSLVSSSCLKHH